MTVDLTGKMMLFEEMTGDLNQLQKKLVIQIMELTKKIEKIKEKLMPEITSTVESIANTKNALSYEIEVAKDIFVKPKTRIMNNIQIGLSKKAKTIEWEDNDTVVNNIKDIIKSDAHKYIKKKEKPLKTSLMQGLDDSILESLGIIIVPPTDIVVIRNIESEVEKTIKSITKVIDKEIKKLTKE